MPSLRLFLFGAPRLEHNGVVALRRSKALALLAYLAVRGQPQQREALLALLWPEFDELSARNNLRRELSLLKSTLGQELLVADRMQVACNPEAQLWLDVAEWSSLLAAVDQHAHQPGELCSACAESLTAATRLQTDDFMAGFALAESPAFDDWQFFQREELRRRLSGSLQTLVAWHAGAQAYDAALGYARRWLQLDPLHEPAHRELMRLYAWSGRHAAALRQFEECARLLDDELGAEPEDETTELYAAVKARRLEAPAPLATPTAGAGEVESEAVEPVLQLQHRPLHNLPSPTASFVGRRRELMDLIRRLTDPDCRLLTLTGPGGIGKTQLALQAAHTIAEGWAGTQELADGVIFVPLAAIDTLGGFVPALAAAAQLNFYPNVSPAQQVLEYFRAKRMLLVLDNFEQLLEAVDFVGELLTAAPGLRLLVTSRSALNLQQEWFHPVEGLSFPAEDAGITDLAQLAGFDAVRLFDQHARRVRSDFSLHEAREPVVRLCRLVEGMPLAIELAASWLKVLSVEQVVAALERSLDILTARERNVAPRHRSVRAVLAQSWDLLPSGEQHMLAGLAVFRGGFTAEAAEAVVGATLDVLATLVERSFVRYERDGRYGMHELLRQYGAEQLKLSPTGVADAKAAHGTFYIAFLAARRAALTGDDQPAAVAEILAEHENVLAAWQWATAQHDLAAIECVGQSIAVFYEFRGRYREGVNALQLAVESLRAVPDSPARDRALAARLVDLGWMHIRLGELGRARAALEESSALFEVRATAPLPGQASDPVLGLGMVALLEGRYADAARFGAAALRSAELAAAPEIELAASASGGEPTALPGGPARVPSNRPRALFVLARAAHAQGEYLAAREYAEDALAGAAELGHSWLVASLHNELGNTLVALGENREAIHHYQTYYALRETFDDRRGMATALHGLGRVALREARYADAQALFERSLAILRHVGAQVDTGMTLDGLAAVAVAAGDYDEARRCLCEALELALASAGEPLLLTVLTSAARLLLTGDTAMWGAEALVLVQQHPALDREISDRAARLREQYERELAPELLAAAVRRGQRGTLSRFIPQLQAILQQRSEHSRE